MPDDYMDMADGLTGISQWLAKTMDDITDMMEAILEQASVIQDLKDQMQKIRKQEIQKDKELFQKLESITQEVRKLQPPAGAEGDA